MSSGCLNRGSVANNAHLADTFPVVLCRPLSKTVRFNVLRVIPAGSGNKKGFKGF
jgi:hypothetical protein